MKAFEEQKSFLDVLLEQPEITATYSKEEISEWLVAENYIGLAAEKVDEVINHLKEKRLLEQ
jgi:adenylosuccinate lyase